MRCSVGVTRVILNILVLSSLAATCSVPDGRAERQFPGPDELRAWPGFVVLADGISITSDPFLVFGTDETFLDLRDILVPRLVDNGWDVRSEDVQYRPREYVLVAQRGRDTCIYYWSLNEDAPGTRHMRMEAIRINPQFAEEASKYTTVFCVLVSNCG